MKKTEDELNEWVKTCVEVQPEYEYCEEDDQCNIIFNKNGNFIVKCYRWDDVPENVGVDSNTPFFKKFNRKCDDIDEVELLRKYLNDEEILSGLDNELYWNLKTDKVSKDYVRSQEIKKIKEEISEKEKEIEDLKEQIIGDDFVKYRTINVKIYNRPFYLLKSISGKMSLSLHNKLKDVTFGSMEEFETYKENLIKEGKIVE